MPQLGYATVVVPVVTAFIVHPNNVLQLLKILFVGFLLFGAFVSSRHFNVLPRGSPTEETSMAETFAGGGG